MDKRENSSKVYSDAAERKYCQCSLLMERVTNQIQKGLLSLLIQHSQMEKKIFVQLLKSACAHAAPCKQGD